MCIRDRLIAACKSDTEIVETTFDNGKIKERYSRSLIDFAKEGEFTRFYESGSIEEIAHYSKDTLNGTRILFFENGDTSIVETHQSGTFEGLYKSYYPGNILKANGQYLKGEISGEWRYFYDNKQLKEVVQFANGEENGPFIEYYANGNIKAKGTYKTTEENIDSHKEHGELELYNEDGTIQKKMNCNLGVCRTTWTAENESENKTI